MSNSTVPQSVTMVRPRQASVLLGHSLATFYRRKDAGLIPPTVSLGDNSEALALHEIDAINRARLRGESEDQIRALVRELVEARKAS
jgi:prophage regulatory protein